MGCFRKCLVVVGVILCLLGAAPGGLTANAANQNRPPTVVADTPRLKVGDPRWFEINEAIRSSATTLANRAAGRDVTQHALRVRAFLLATTGRVGPARQDVVALMAIDSRDRDARMVEGLMDFASRPKNAAEAFSRAIQIDPSARDAYVLRAWGAPR